VVETTLQDARDIFGDPNDTRRTRSNFEEPTLALIDNEPMQHKNFLLVQSSDPQSYG
jgi:hypothetical protein